MTDRLAATPSWNYSSLRRQLNKFKLRFLLSAITSPYDTPHSSATPLFRSAFADVAFWPAVRACRREPASPFSADRRNGVQARLQAVRARHETRSPDGGCDRASAADREHPERGPRAGNVCPVGPPCHG